jgi:hypothetical protein
MPTWTGFAANGGSDFHERQTLPGCFDSFPKEAMMHINTDATGHVSTSEPVSRASALDDLSQLSEALGGY